jgi:hypothetical protein|tara:strand:+ start:19 stop:423 length:405 start_codon:yes stop_codon:yes gene_type:complete
MAKIKAPGWATDAIPTTRGWETTDGELLIARKHKQAELNQYHGIVPEAPTFNPEAVDENLYTISTSDENLYTMYTGDTITVDPAELLTEAPIGNVALGKMTKVQLESLGNEHGVELNRRLTKAKMVEQLKKVLV